MERIVKALLVFCLLTLRPFEAHAASKGNRQAGFGFGAVSAYPVSTFPYALMAVLEGTYRLKLFGLSVLAAATSSPSVEGTYWFGANGSSEQTIVEPRIYLSVFHFGFSLGLNISSGTTGEVQSVASYGGMAGIEIPFGPLSLGVDARYLRSSGSNPSPLSTIAMFRVRL